MALLSQELGRTGISGFSKKRDCCEKKVKISLEMDCNEVSDSAKESISLVPFGLSPFSFL